MYIKIISGVAILAAVITGVILISGYFGQKAVADSYYLQVQNEKKTLQQTAKNLDNLDAEISTLQKNLQETQDLLEGAGDFIPVEVDSNEILKNILTRSQDLYLTVIPLQTNDWTPVNINGHSYRVFKISLEVNGSLEGILEYLTYLQDYYNTLIIESVDYSRSTPTPTVESSEVAPEVINLARIQLAIYAR